MTEPSADVPDWSRETPHGFWDPSRRLLKAVRDYQSGGRLGRKLAVLRHRFWTIVAQAEVPLHTELAGGLMMPHPNGIVIHGEAVVGPNCVLFQQVTLGTREGRTGAPVLEGRVDVGAGARILGPVRIGRHAIIGANAVVVDDVPAGAVAVGIPARVRSKEGTTST